MQVTQKTHPLVLTAAAAVIIMSLVAVASMMGFLPSSTAKGSDPAQTELADAKTDASASTTDSQTAAASTASKASSVSKSTTKQTSNHGSAPTQVAKADTPAPVTCRDCGYIAEIREKKVQGEGTGLGAVAGGIAGAIIGKQFGNGNGQKAMTAAGAVGGAVLGNKIEKDQRSSVSYDVVVRFDDGTSGVYHFENRPQWQEGDKVKVVNGQIQGRV